MQTPTSQSTALVTAVVDDRVAQLTLNRYEALNALSRELIVRLDQTLSELEERDDVHVVLLCSSGRHFCAGADIEDMSALDFKSATADGYVGCSKQLGSFSKPVIVAVEGMALGGGCEMVEMCDIVIASEDAIFSHPEITLNAMPGAGGTQRLSRVVGKHLAMDMLLSARPLTAHEAKEAGLVSRIVEPGQAISQAMEVARSMATRPLALLRRTKASVLNSLPSLDSGLASEAKYFRECFNETTFQEALREFTQKQKAKRH